MNVVINVTISLFAMLSRHRRPHYHNNVELFETDITVLIYNIGLAYCTAFDDEHEDKR